MKRYRACGIKSDVLNVKVCMYIHVHIMKVLHLTNSLMHTCNLLLPNRTSTWEDEPIALHVAEVVVKGENLSLAASEEKTRSTAHKKSLWLIAVKETKRQTG